MVGSTTTCQKWHFGKLERGQQNHGVFFLLIFLVKKLVISYSAILVDFSTSIYYFNAWRIVTRTFFIMCCLVANLWPSSQKYILVQEIYVRIVVELWIFRKLQSIIYESSLLLKPNLNSIGATWWVEVSALQKVSKKNIWEKYVCVSLNLKGNI